MDGNMTAVGFLHPGKMGVTLASNAHAKTLWASAGRSTATVQRAESAGVVDAGTVEEMCGASDIVVSICPPDSAVTVAEHVAATGFTGTYVDANAISPATSVAISGLFERYIDGGVIGPPALEPGTTRMYLAGPGADDVAAIWDGSALDVRVIGPSAEGARASALKMAYAGWTKGSAALLLAINALAEASGVADELRVEWGLSQPGLAERSERMAPMIGAKAWRFSGEMHEIAATMDGAGVTASFHEGSADVYQRLAGFKDTPDAALADLLEALLASDAAQ